MINLRNKRNQIPAWLLPAAILLLGALLRLLFLGSVPGGLHQDEAFVAYNGLSLFHEHTDSGGHLFPIYMADWGDGHSALYVWLLQPIILLTGGGLTAFFSRLPQAIVSIVTLLAVYGIGKRLINKTFGLWAMFLLAICPWHVMMSRWGLDANLAPGFLCFGLYFFILGLENKKFLLLSGLLYGLSLYSYAVIWPIVPFLLLLQIIYGLYHRKLSIDRYSLSASGILFLLALPLLLFILVNSEIIPEISLPFMTIPKMGGYRGGELAFGLSEMLANLKQTIALLYRQNVGAPYDILLPWGLFYNIGRLFILFGIIVLLFRQMKCILHKEYTGEFFLLCQLLGGGLVSILVYGVLHQINALYIPLVLCEAYGVYTLLSWCKAYKEKVYSLSKGLLVMVYFICLCLFQRDYYTDYRTLADAYFAIGMEECVDFALKQCEDTGLSTITVEKGAQWPRLLLFTETLPSQYLSTVEYDVYPAPESFQHGEIRINTRIHYEEISQDSIYIIYYTDAETFEKDFALTKFYDWYVATPHTPTSY